MNTLGGVVCDPMVGGGAFGVAALRLGAARFVGADVSEECVATTLGRLGECV